MSCNWCTYGEPCDCDGRFDDPADETVVNAWIAEAEEPQEGASQSPVAMNASEPANGAPSCGSGGGERSERRQSNLTEDIAHVVSLYGADDVRRELESQEGAPSVGSSAGTGTGGVPSCGSELAAIRRRDALYTDDDCFADSMAGHRRYLLRMVGELAYQLAEEKNAAANDRDPSYHEERLKRENDALGIVTASQQARIVELESYAQASAKERDDLRAKLDGCRGSAYVLELDVARIRADRDKWKGKTEELEAKLAEMGDYVIALEKSVHTSHGVQQELEAKLADAERAWRTWNENMSIEASKWEQQCEEMEAKLAEAEKKLEMTAKKLSPERLVPITARNKKWLDNWGGNPPPFAGQSAKDRHDLLGHIEALEAELMSAAIHKYCQQRIDFEERRAESAEKELAEAGRGDPDE